MGRYVRAVWGRYGGEYWEDMVGSIGKIRWGVWGRHGGEYGEDSTGSIRKE